MREDNEKGLARWAMFRFSVIGGLLANPPRKGELREGIQRLASQSYAHPTKNKRVTFSFSTIERWYYKALGSADPLSALGRRIRRDAGSGKAMSGALLEELKKQHQLFPHWSYQLHADNLTALTLEKPWLKPAPSYSTVLRRMKGYGWTRKKVKTSRKTKGQIQAIERLESKEVRSYESEYVNALWHLDFHHGRKVADERGNWRSPKALCVLDDRSRLCCHIQWYWEETSESLIHGLSQAFYKRGLPRALMSDNGSAMTSAEFEGGLLKLSINHAKTLPYSPYQNGKQESFWGRLEGRLMAMLARVEPLTLEFLNRSTQAWVEQEYNRSIHEETGQAPLDRLIKGPDVGRPAPSGETLSFSFTAVESRTQRVSDGTVQIKGVRFEVPARLGHIKRLTLAYKPWDLSMAYLVDPKTGDNLGRIYPIDKSKNAMARRKALDTTAPEKPTIEGIAEAESIPPLLRKLLSDYAATGLPPAYLPKNAKDMTNPHGFTPEDIF